DGGTGATAYADAVATYLGLAVSRSANSLCTLAIWSHSRDQSVNVFSRQALAMTWDFPEVNPFAGAAGDFGETCASMSKTVAGTPARGTATVELRDASESSGHANTLLIQTDPPYYDNIGYADLSDFFFTWLRPSLRTVYPNLFSTLLSPKQRELVATPYRFGGNKLKAKEFFERGLGAAFSSMYSAAHPDYPLTAFYAFKQTEAHVRYKEEVNGKSALSSTGWETMLQGLLDAGFSITGTWPMRTERPTGVKVATNALASSIVLVFRPRPQTAATTTRGEFLRELRRKLPAALRTMQQASIAPVDLAQAAIGPGMAIYSAYAAVLEPGGERLRVRTALQLINQVRDEALSEQDSEYDRETGWAIDWFAQYG
ncbi:MAG: hypothetical protein M3509_10585, partial [Chloroflexota bacterium]|nr:hypothetical protein [Chloroflexota bacterium]